MPFPVSVTGRVELPDSISSAQAGDLLKAVGQRLHEHGAEIQSQTSTSLVATVPFVRPGGRWDFVGPLNRIDVAVDNTGGGMTLRYRGALVRLLIAVTLLVCAAGLTFWRQIATEWRWFLPLAWAWLFGGNYLKTSIHAPMYFKRILEEFGARKDNAPVRTAT